MTLKDQIAFESGKVVSLTLAQNPNVGMRLLALDAGQELSTHAASGDAFVNVLEGSAQIKIDGQPFELSAGQAIILPATIPHSVKALTPFKMLLTVIKA